MNFKEIMFNAFLNELAHTDLRPEAHRKIVSPRLANSSIFYDDEHPVDSVLLDSHTLKTRYNFSIELEKGNPESLIGINEVWSDIEMYACVEKGVTNDKYYVEITSTKEPGRIIVGDEGITVVNFG